jgi:hypothetical protein
MYLIIECLIMGLAAVIACIISYNIINNDIGNSSKTRSCLSSKIIVSFCCGFIIHLIIKKSHLTDMYCKKICYNNECYMVCPINH